MQQLSPAELSAWLNDESRSRPQLLDCREPWEFDVCRIEGARLIPMRTIPLRLEELARDQDVVCICHHGGRSQQVAMFLQSRGFPRVHNLAGGVNAWALQVDPGMPRY